MIQKIIPILSILLCSFFIAKGQTDPLSWSINRQIYFARYAEAKTAAEIAVQNRANAPNSYSYAVALSELGHVRLVFAQYKAADSLLTIALLLFEEQHTTADSAYLKTCTWAAETCRELAQFPRAEVLLKRGLQATEACKNTPHEVFRAELLLEYAKWDAELSRFQQAELHCALAIAVLEKALGKKSPKVAGALTAWGAFENSTKGAYKAAEPLLGRAIKILEPISQQYPVEYLSALTEQARLFSWGLPRYKESQQILEKAVAFGKKQLGSHHTSVAWALRILGNYYIYNTPQFYQADTLFQEAANIYVYHFGENYPYYIGTLQDISEWYGTMGYVQKSAEIRQQAFEICRKVYGDRHPTTANLMLAYAETQKNAGNPLQADSMLRIVDTIYHDFYGDMHKSRITMLETQASFASSKQNNHVADSLYHRALAKEEQLNGQKTPNWWSIISSISTQNWASDLPDRADSLIQTEILFDKTEYGEMSLQYASDWWELFFVYNSSAAKKPKEAELAIRKNMMITENILGQDNHHYLFGLNQLTGTLIKQRRFEDAEKIISQRETLIKKIYGEKSGPWVELLDDKIDLFKKSRTPSEVIPYRSQALEIRRALGDNNGWMRGIRDFASALTDLGRYAEADSMNQQLLNIYKSHYGTESGDYLFALLNSVFLYYNTCQYQKMKNCLDSAAVVDNILGNSYEHLIYKIRGNYYDNMGNYKEAANIWLIELKLEPDAGNHNRFGAILTELDQYALADSILRAGLSKAEDDPNIKISLYLNLCDNLNHWGKHENEAFEFAQNALDLAKQTYGENHPDYATTLNTYAIALGKLGRFEEEEEAYKKVLAIQTGNPGELATTLNNLGLLYYYLGRIQEAESLTIQSLKLREDNLGPDHPDCIGNKQRLADYYISSFWKPLAADSLISLVTSYWQSRAPQSRQYADAILLRGKFFTYVGEFEKAEVEIKKARDIYKNVIGDQSWEVANCLNELALNYTEAAKQVQGTPKNKLLLQSLENVKASTLLESNLKGRENINHATHLNNIAATYYQIGNADSVIYYQLQSLELRKRLQGEKNPASGRSYSTLAGAYEMQHRYSEAESTCRKGLAILAETTGKESEDYILCARGMGSILLAMGKTTEALHYFEEDRKATISKIKKTFGYFSSAEQIKAIQRYRPDYYYSAALTYRYPEIAKMCYNDALLFKGAGLRNNRTLREILSASKDSAELKRYDQYLSIEKTIAAEYRLRKEERIHLDSLQSVSQEIERELRTRSADYRNYINRLDVNWQAIQAKLQAGDASIEFVRFNRKRVIDTDTFLYAALVLLPGKEAPVFVPLCAESELKTKLFGNQVAITDRTVAWATNIYSPETNVRANRVKGTSLYNLIWQPLDTLLKGVHRVYFSPDGLLHHISFAALGYLDKSENKVFLRDSFQLIQMASTRQVLFEQASIELAPGEEVLVVGDIQYGTINTKESARSLEEGCSFSSIGKDEFAEACKLYRQYQQKVVQLSGADATERNIIDILNSHKSFRAISLITHGMFLPSPIKCSKIEHLYSEVNPMQRSCLVFAGINAVNAIRTYADDCLLTAQDFAGLNLSGTEVVIIPACESGLGDVLSSEGVFGLQRAFQEAGARYLIIALWKLPDGKTSSFMQKFYSQWLEEKKSVPDAFREAQRQTREENTDAGMWGGLILIE